MAEAVGGGVAAVVVAELEDRDGGEAQIERPPSLWRWNMEHVYCILRKRIPYLSNTSSQVISLCDLLQGPSYTHTLKTVILHVSLDS